MLDLLRQAGYTDSASSIRFVNDIEFSNGGSSTDAFDIRGVPTIAIINRHSQLVWKGRFCCYDYTDFETFMHHTLSEATDIKCANVHCELCRGEISIDKDLADLHKEQKCSSQYADLIVKPSSDQWAG